MSDTGNIGRRIATARKTKGLNQNQLAKALNVTRSAVSYWEKGRSEEIKTSILVKLSDVTDTNLRWLATGQGTPVRRIINGPDEAELLDIYRDLKPATQIALLATARALMGADETPSTKRHPFKTARPVGQYPPPLASPCRTPRLPPFKYFC